MNFINLFQIENWIESGSNKIFELGTLPDFIASYLALLSPVVHLSRETSEKIRSKHSEVTSEILMVASDWERHRYFNDNRKAGKQTLIVVVSHNGKLFKMALKRTGKGEAYLLTVHRTHANQLRSFEKKHVELKRAQ